MIRGVLSRSTPHVGRWVAVAAVLLVAVATTTWWLTAAHAVDQVDATWSPHCRGTEVTSGTRGTVVLSRPGWRCRIDLTLENGSGRSVRLTRVESQLLGSEGRAEVQGLSTSGARVRDAADGSGVDAAYDVDVVLPAHARRTVHFDVGWRPQGCNAAGDFHLERWPTLVLSALHRTHVRRTLETFTLRTYDDPHDARACP